MSEQGPSLRAELNQSFKDPKTLSDKIKDIAKGDDAEYTPDDFISDRLRKRNDDSKNRMDHNKIKEESILINADKGAITKAIFFNHNRSD